MPTCSSPPPGKQGSSQRLIVSTTDRWSSNAEDHVVVLEELRGRLDDARSTLETVRADTSTVIAEVRASVTTVPTVPTVLAMQGMANLAIDLLGFPVVVAIALAGYLELALVFFALLTRASALAGRPGGVDAAAAYSAFVVDRGSNK